MLLGEQDLRRSDRMEPEEATGGHEREREQQDARVTSPIGRLARRVTENECHRADDPEDDKVEPVVLDVRIEPRAKQQRHEPDQRQCGSDEADDDERTCARAPSKRCSPTRTHDTDFGRPRFIGFLDRRQAKSGAAQGSRTSPLILKASSSASRGRRPRTAPRRGSGCRTSRSGDRGARSACRSSSAR
jgi:hypothetical protein